MVDGLPGVDSLGWAVLIWWKRFVCPLELVKEWDSGVRVQTSGFVLSFGSLSWGLFRGTSSLGLASSPLVSLVLYKSVRYVAAVSLLQMVRGAPSGRAALRGAGERK